MANLRDFTVTTAACSRRTHIPSCCLLLALTVALCSTAVSGAVNCRVDVYHETCRGVMARSGRQFRSRVRDGHALRKLLRQYFSADDSRTRKIKALKKFFAAKRPSYATSGKTQSLLNRLLRNENRDPAFDDEHNFFGI